MNPVAESSGEKVFDMLRPFLEDKVPTELDLRRIEHEARKLMNSDPGHAHSFLGGVAALKGDLKAVNKHFKIAMDIDGETFDHLANYGQSLKMCSDYDRALEFTLKAIAVNIQIEVLDSAITLAKDLNHDSLDDLLKLRAEFCGKEINVDWCFGLGSLESTIRDREDLITPLDEDLFNEALELVEGVEVE